MGWGSGSGKGYCKKHGKKLKNGQCPKWGCKAKAVASEALSDPANNARRKDGSRKNSLWDAKGRNVNGIRYDNNGKRIWNDD